MIYLDFGRRELGKTTLAYWMARRLDRRMVFDPRGMIRQGTTVTTRADLAAAMDELSQGEISEVVYTPRGDVQRGFELFSSYVSDWVQAFPKRKIAVLVDEVAFVKTDVAAFQWVLRCSTREATHVWLTAHRPSDIQTNIRAIADHWLLFACRQEHDWRVIEERCSVAVSNAVRRLKPREFVHWNDARGEFKLFADPSTWYIDLTAADSLEASLPAIGRG